MLKTLTFRPTLKTVTGQNKNSKDAFKFLILKGGCQQVSASHTKTLYVEKNILKL